MAELRIPEPSEKQCLFMADRHKYIGYGGARGGGKSWAVRVKAVLLCLRYAGIKVGSAAPYDVYIYDGVSGEWINNGTIQGAKGDTGAAGTTFTPHVDGNGNLSWTNDGGLENPATQNIRGAAGAKGETGAAGKSAYTAAVEAG